MGWNKFEIKKKKQEEQHPPTSIYRYENIAHKSFCQPFYPLEIKT